METQIVTSNICACGNKREEKQSLDRRKEVRLIKVLVVITCVACVTSVLSCIYTVITMYRYQQIRHKDGQLTRTKPSTDKLVSAVVSEDTREPRDSKIEIHRMKSKSDVRHVGFGGQKRTFDYQHNMRMADPTNQNRNPDPSFITAAHYVSVEITTIPAMSNGDCERMWDGTVCPNSTYWSDHRKQVVKFFIPSDWMKTSHQMPLNETTPGNFKALHSGVYLLYLNMMIHASAVKHDVAIYINKIRRLDCRETLDVVPTPFDPLNRFKNTKSKTCSISGVFHINEGDIINIKIETRNTPVVLRKDTTNFGAILLTSGST